jgi:phage recombination protein Bet
VTAPATALVPTEGRTLTSAEMLSGLRTVKSVLAPDLTDDELKLFAMVAARSGLDPFAKQIYAVKRKGRATFQTGIDGYRSIADRTGLYDGQDEPEYGPTIEKPFAHPEWATVRVYRKDMGRPIAATAFWDEYVPGDGQDHMWRKMPRVMLAKVAEALALRKGFPYDPERKQGIGADLYTADEMAQADRGPVPAAARPGLQERLAARRSQATEQPAADVDVSATAEAEPTEIEGESRDVESSAFEDAPATSELAAMLRTAAGEQDDTTTAAAPAQIKAVRTGPLAALATGAINAGIAIAFGAEAKTHPSAAQVRAIELVADSMGTEAFAVAWAAMVNDTEVQ